MDWIGAILERIRTMECPACGARLASCAVRGITAEPHAVVVKLACTVCGESSIAQSVNGSSRQMIEPGAKQRPSSVITPSGISTAVHW